MAWFTNLGIPLNGMRLSRKAWTATSFTALRTAGHSATRLTGSKGQFQAGEPVEVWFLKREGLHVEKV